MHSPPPTTTASYGVTFVADRAGRTSAVSPSLRTTTTTASAILAVDPFVGRLLRPPCLPFRQPAITMVGDAEGLSSVADRPPGRADRPMVRGAWSEQA
ncbi:hypothetical protein [Streptomyces sp. NPDC088254]|uniref:hypothetical protein n=1 Tax=Streptomyces sp. NPDC088254 TaxID=3365847 RepID=UPI003825A442